MANSRIMLSRDIAAGQKLMISTTGPTKDTIFTKNSVFWRSSDNTFWDDVLVTNTSGINNNFHIYLDNYDKIHIVVAGEGGTFQIRNTNPTQNTKVAFGGHGSVRGGFANAQWFGRGCGNNQGFGGGHAADCPTKFFNYNSNGSNTYTCNSATFGYDPVPDVAKHCLVELTSANQPYGIFYRIDSVHSSSTTTVEYQNQVFPI